MSTCARCSSKSPLSDLNSAIHIYLQFDNDYRVQSMVFFHCSDYWSHFCSPFFFYNLILHFAFICHDIVFFFFFGTWCMYCAILQTCWGFFVDYVWPAVGSVVYLGLVNEWMNVELCLTWWEIFAALQMWLLKLQTLRVH